MIIGQLHTISAFYGSCVSISSRKSLLHKDLWNEMQIGKSVESRFDFTTYPDYLSLTSLASFTLFLSFVSEATFQCKESKCLAGSTFLYPKADSEIFSNMSAQHLALHIIYAVNLLYRPCGYWHNSALDHLCRPLAAYFPVTRGRQEGGKRAEHDRIARFSMDKLHYGFVHVYNCLKWG